MGELRYKVGEVIKQIPLSLTKQESTQFIHFVDDDHFHKLQEETLITVKICVYSDGSTELAGEV
jgi:hypothetical protein